MRALVQYAKESGALELRDVDVPILEPDDLLIRVKSAGICGADIEFYRAKLTSILRPPVVLGHEFCGIVERVGANVKDWKPGDRVVSENTGYICGKCFACLTGQYVLCADRRGIGYSMDGAFAEFVRIPGEILRRFPAALHRLPDVLSFEEGAIIEPSCNAYKAVVQEGELRAGEIIAVFGPGPIGLFSVQLARIAGASAIFLFGVAGDEARLQLGRQLGADVATVVQGSDVDGLVESQLGKQQVDLAIDAAGADEVLPQAIKLLRPGGRIVKVAWGKRPRLLDLDPLMSKGSSIIGHFGYDYISWRNVLRLASKGRIDYHSFISHTYSLDEWKEAFSAVESRKAIKAVFNKF